MKRSAISPIGIQSDGIQSDGVYTLQDFQARLGLGRHWMRSARASGLRILRFGNRSFVRGADFIAFLDSTEAKNAGEH